LTELGKSIEVWLDKGYQIIVAGDFNEDVTSATIKRFFEKLSMKELIIQQNGINTPNKFINGYLPIDGIFATTGITPIVSGYTAFSWGLYSDHRLLWVDLTLQKILGC
jgi:endonuclease/exonuclease/phosphatase (EEP) superfamily protein YafD